MADIPRHGGDIAAAAARYGIPPAEWLDLSTGVNPNRYQAPAVTADDWASLPSPAALASLLDIARSAYELAPEAGIGAFAGSEAAIRLLPLVAPPGPVAIVGPTYGSHAEAWAFGNGSGTRSVVTVGALAAVPNGAAIVVVGNPNNPDGRTAAPRTLSALALSLARRGGLLVVDEAFADLVPEVSLCPSLAGTPAVVLRSFGKFYGLPGLRLGFAAGPPALIERMSRLAGDWPISSAALAIGTAALQDYEWQAEMRDILAEDRERLIAVLGVHGIRVLGGTDLFILAGHPQAEALHERLAHEGIWTRVFKEPRNALRIGLPPNEGFARLDQALGAALSGL